MPVTITQLLNAVEISRSFNNFRQEIMHLQDKLTDTDVAIHARKLCRQKMADPTDKIPFNFKDHRLKYIGVTYSEFLAQTEEE